MATRLVNASGVRATSRTLLWPAMRNVSITSQPTPNPDSLMFTPEGKIVLGPGYKSLEFKSKFATKDSPLAQALFRVQGVNEVLLAAKHVTISKRPNLEWDALKGNIETVMAQFFEMDIEIARKSALQKEGGVEYEEGSIEAQLLELIEERIKPFVQQDGGDVELHHFDASDGTVYLTLQGSCAGCPKSNVTLQMGIKNMLQHYIPEVKEVAAMEEEEEIPRPR